MSNMGYCRFENTFSDLGDCYDHIHDEDLSENEKGYRQKLVDLCKDIVEEGELYTKHESKEEIEAKIYSEDK